MTNRKPVDEPVRKLIINAWENREASLTKAELAKVIGLPRSTVRNILKIYYTEGRISPKKRGRAAPFKITQEILNFIVENLDKNADLTNAQIVQLVEERYGVHVHVKTSGHSYLI
jgi:transposase